MTALHKLAELHSTGLLTDAEYEQALAMEKVEHEQAMATIVNIEVPIGRQDFGCCSRCSTTDPEAPAAYSYWEEKALSWQPFDAATSHVIACRTIESPHGGRCDLSAGWQLRWGYDLRHTDYTPPVERSGILAFFIGQPEDQWQEFNDRIEETATGTGLVMTHIESKTVRAVRRDQKLTWAGWLLGAFYWTGRQLDRPAVRPALIMGLALLALGLFISHVGVVWFSVIVWAALAAALFTSVKRRVRARGLAQSFTLKYTALG